jgi:hypothetical protein
MNCRPQSQEHDVLRLERRDCLRLMLGTVLALCSAPYDRMPAWLQAELEHGLRGFGAHAMGGGALLRRLGESYLAVHPQERDMPHLLRSLLGAHARPTKSNTLFESIGRDLATHDVALLDGWVLARTEARACALLHMIQGTAA